MYQPYDKDTATLEDRIAWALCQIIDDDAPMRWTRYRFAAVCIANNPELMADLNRLAEVPAAHCASLTPAGFCRPTSELGAEAKDAIHCAGETRDMGARLSRAELGGNI